MFVIEKLLYGTFYGKGKENVVLGEGTLRHLQKFNISNKSYLNSPLPPFSFIISSPHSGTASTGIIFPFTHMCTQ
jgi:hypothetical protein